MARAREDFASFVRARWAELTDELVEDGLTREQAQQAAVRGLADCQPGWRRVLAEDNPEVVVRDSIASYRDAALPEEPVPDPLAAIDIPNLCRETGDALEEAADAAGALTFRIRKT